MSNQQHDKSHLSTRLLQKIFIVVLVATYLIDTFLQLRSRTSESRQFIELLLLLLIPVGYFILSYLVNSRKQLRLLSVFQSLAASIAAYVFWNTMVSVMQNLHRAYTANLKMYYATAIVTGILLIAVLLYLRNRKNW
jgi:glucan phosphoethanolaminetransferase (alkaline phosphatase superfamily)